MLRTAVSIVLLCCCCNCFSQSAGPRGRTYSFKEMEQLLKARHYNLLYPSWLEKVFPEVTMELDSTTSLNDLLHEWLLGLAVKTNIQGNSIVLFPTGDNQGGRGLYNRLEGVVVNTQMEAIARATVTNNLTSKGDITNSNGIFRLRVAGLNTPVAVSCVGYKADTVVLNNRAFQMIVLLEAEAHGLDAVEVMAYGVTSKRVNIGASCTTSGINSIGAPGGNLQEALKARVPGLFIADLNGVAGSAKSITIGGNHSLQQNNDPLYVVDGVPLARDGFLRPFNTGNAQGPAGASVLNFIAPDNVAGITVLKDAVATSIYGSRASNGVVLITLKQGRPGRLRLSFDVSGGVQEAVKTSPLLSTSQFLSLRKEAVQNDGGNADSLPEANYWDPTRHTDYKRLTMGRTAPIWNGGVQASWGSARSAFFLSGQLHRESTVFPGSTSDERRSIFGLWRGQSDNSRLKWAISGIYGWESNHLPQADLSAYQWLAPNSPLFRDRSGVAQWGQGTTMPFVNIPALENNDYLGKTYTFLGHLQLSYRLGRHFYLEESIGYNGIHLDEHSYLRDSGQNPNNSLGNVTDFDRNRYAHTMTETVGRWSGRLGGGTVEGLAGFDYQWRKVNYSSSLYGSDSIPYNYHAIFARVTYDIAGKYLLTSSARQDKSTVLGAAEPLGLFWTLGGAWIFSRERFLAGNKIISHGKLRASWGTTGNEPLEEALAAEVALMAMARGLPPIAGRRLTIPAQPPLHWELNYREDLALELGFLQDRLFFTAAVNRAWTANQVILSPFVDPTQLSGLLSNQRGIDIENRAVEFGLQVNHVHLGKLGLASSIVLTVPRNRIARWPGLDSSIYAGKYTVGHSITSIRNYRSTGVDPIGGLYTFQTANPSGIPDERERVPNRGTDAAWHAGWSQRLTLGNWELEWLFDYRRQRGINPLIVLDLLNPPGVRDSLLGLSNGPVEWLDHWRKRGDVAHQQRVTAGGDTAAMTRLAYYENSDAWSIGASYLRLRRLTLSYRLSVALAKRLGFREGRISISGQNLWTKTRFPVTDPETQYPNVLPPMRIIVAGIHIGF